MEQEQHNEMVKSWIKQDDKKKQEDILVYRQRLADNLKTAYEQLMNVTDDIDRLQDNLKLVVQNPEDKSIKRNFFFVLREVDVNAMEFQHHVLVNIISAVIDQLKLRQKNLKNRIDELITEIDEYGHMEKDEENNV